MSFFHRLDDGNDESASLDRSEELTEVRDPGSDQKEAPPLVGSAPMGREEA